jgi:tRNA A-37 threonylcarbamoyl transferase component Bud32
LPRPLGIELSARYQRKDLPGATLVARDDVFSGLQSALERAPTLHAFAGREAGARRLQGRDAAFALQLPESDRRGVIRHNRHGGLLRSLTGDRFLWPTRAPQELMLSEELRRLRVPTPAVLAFAIYPAGAFATSDVITEEIAGATDFGELLLRTTPDAPDRLHAWNAVKRLMKRLASAGVRHHDFNAKNILLQSTDDGLFTAWVLDVDRIELDCTRRDAYAGNRARLRRSVEKFRDVRGAVVTDAELAGLRGTSPNTTELRVPS